MSRLTDSLIVAAVLSVANAALPQITGSGIVGRFGAVQAANSLPITGGTLTGSLAVNGGPIANGTGNMFSSATSFTGSLGSGSYYTGNDVSVGPDSLAYTGGSYVSGQHIIHSFGGAGMTGNRAGLHIQLIMNATTSNTGNTTQYYVALPTFTSCPYNDNGSAGFSNAFGSCVGLNPVAELGGTFWYTLNPEEVDTVIDGGGSDAHTFGELNVKSGAGPQGTYDDAAYDFAAGTSNPTWKYLLQVGKTDGVAPTDSSTTVLGCVEKTSAPVACAVGYGIDLRNFNVSNYAFASTGYTVDGSGNMAAASYKVGSTAGVSCSGVPTASYQVTNGIVTHC